MSTQSVCAARNSVFYTDTFYLLCIVLRLANRIILWYLIDTKGNANKQAFPFRSYILSSDFKAILSDPRIPDHQAHTYRVESPSTENKKLMIWPFPESPDQKIQILVIANRKCTSLTLLTERFRSPPPAMAKGNRQNRIPTQSLIRNFSLCQSLKHAFHIKRIGINRVRPDQSDKNLSPSTFFPHTRPSRSREMKFDFDYDSGRTRTKKVIV